ncbi:MAG: MFS transporter [Myxococcales bacterium]|nr:MFS transporter [Myxococcales bacterium]
MADTTAAETASPSQPIAPAGSPAPGGTAAGKKGHPPALYVLFFAEMWERFSYYGMRALLVLYLVNHLHVPKDEALKVYGLYTGLVYLTPIVGGWLADNYLGKRKSVIIGGTLMMLGHLAMASEPLLYQALGLLIIGNGFFKPNISTMVGELYEQGDPRRDGGFTIFYMGINLGAFFSPLVCGTLGESERFGWHYGFSAAAIGMFCGLAVFLGGQRLLGTIGFPTGRAVTADSRLNGRDWRDILLIVAGCTLGVQAILRTWGTLGPILGTLPALVWLALGLGLIFYAIMKGGGEEGYTSVDWQRMIVIFVLLAFNVVFWAGFEQAGGTMTLFADTQTDRHVFGWEIPASYFQAINPLGIVLMAPLFSRLWLKLDGGVFPIATPAKMGIGIVILGLGFIVMFIASQLAGAGQVGAQWLFAVYVIHTIGELCLSPIGLSMITKLAPARIISLFMGLWFTSSAIANYLAGSLETLLKTYQINLWAFLFAVPIGCGLLLMALTPVLKKHMHGRG